MRVPDLGAGDPARPGHAGAEGRGKITLYRAGTRADAEARFPHAGPLLTRTVNFDLIAEHYDDFLRLAGSLKFGHATASLLVGKLSAFGRQNALAAALEEYRRVLELPDEHDAHSLARQRIASPATPDHLE